MAEILTAVLIAIQPAAPSTPEQREQAPLEFRCDTMQVLTEPNRTICRENVVIRRADLLVCCRVFEGIADKDWGWQRFTCTEDVRAQRTNEIMWAEKAEFILETSALILTGSPTLHRGKSILRGARVIVDTKNDHAKIVQPRGRIQAANGRPSEQAAPLEGPVPDACPIPGAP